MRPYLNLWGAVVKRHFDDLTQDLTSEEKIEACILAARHRKQLVYNLEHRLSASPELVEKLLHRFDTLAAKAMKRAEVVKYLSSLDLRMDSEQLDLF